MAELVVQSHCKSSLKTSLDLALNVTFPIWGVTTPVLTIVFLLIVISNLQFGTQVKVMESLAYFAICFCFSVFCLLLKRSIAMDSLTVDKQGIRLPRLIGMQVNLRTYIPWKDVTGIAALVPSDNKNEKAAILLSLKNGRSIRLPLQYMQPEFAEQFLLAAQMWQAELCDKSLESLQNLLRLTAGGKEHASYTELWEEELGRRFCPTSYVPLQSGRVLRNSSLKVVSHLSSGGLSALYLCQLDGKKLVVLKEAVAPEGCAENVREKAKEMFEREAQLLMKVDHAGVVHVLDSFSEGERNYLLLEYINGIDLRQLVKQNGAQKESDVLEWAVHIANALKYLHEREQAIIHRDLTPDNIVLRNDGQAIIVDFGAANEFIGTATGTFVGKHSFIAPEQLRGKATIHSDIYAFGCTLFFLLTGQEPEALSPSNPKELAPSVSEELAELVESCTQLEASDRYQSVAQLIPVLRRLAAQSLVV